MPCNCSPPDSVAICYQTSAANLEDKAIVRRSVSLSHHGQELHPTVKGLKWRYVTWDLVFTMKNILLGCTAASRLLTRSPTLEVKPGSNSVKTSKIKRYKIGKYPRKTIKVTKRAP